MRERERLLVQRRLDKEMQPYRRAGRDESPTRGLLRAVRQALGVPTEEIAKKLGVNTSVVFALERRELSFSIQLRSLGRMARAMGCKVVYGIVPRDGETLEELGEERFWRKALKDRDRESREQGVGNREQDGAFSSQLSAISSEDPLRPEPTRDEGTGDLGTGDRESREQGVGNREQDGAFSSQLSAISSEDLVRLEPGAGEIGEELEAAGLGAWDPAIDGGSDSLMDG
jgi:predicted DNA-binding mobile mystery protein A